MNEMHLERFGLTLNDHPTSMTGLSFPRKMNIFIFDFHVNDDEQASEKGLR